jgi:hypothetical protein
MEDGFLRATSSAVEEHFSMFDRDNERRIVIIVHGAQALARTDVASKALDNAQISRLNTHWTPPRCLLSGGVLAPGAAFLENARSISEVRATIVFGPSFVTGSMPLSIR